MNHQQRNIVVEFNLLDCAVVEFTVVEYTQNQNFIQIFD